MQAIVTRLRQDASPLQHPDCCCCLSRPLLELLCQRLPQRPATVLSVGCGTGLLEELILQLSTGLVNLYGVEVPSCRNKHLRSERLLRVTDTAALHSEALLAEALLFVYPRSPQLVASYLCSCVGGALKQIVFIGHHTAWTEEYAPIFSSATAAADVAVIEVVSPSGLPDYEVLVIVSVAGIQPLSVNVESVGKPGRACIQ